MRLRPRSGEASFNTVRKLYSSSSSVIITLDEEGEELKVLRPNYTVIRPQHLILEYSGSLLMILFEKLILIC